MKKLFIFLSLVSVVSCFAAVPKPNASIHGLRYAQAYHLIKEAIKQKAMESDTGELSNEEINEILNKEDIWLEREDSLRIYKQSIPIILGKSCAITIGLGFIGWLLLSQQVSSLKLVVKGGLIAGSGFFIAISILYGFKEGIIDSFGQLKGYKRILDSSYVDIGERFRRFECWNSLLMRDYKNLTHFDKKVVGRLQRELRQLYPSEYPDVDSLKIDFEAIKEYKRAERAMQALFGDVTYADGTKRRRNITMVTAVNELLTEK